MSVSQDRYPISMIPAVGWCALVRYHNETPAERIPIIGWVLYEERIDDDNAVTETELGTGDRYVEALLMFEDGPTTASDVPLLYDGANILRYEPAP